MLELRTVATRDALIDVLWGEAPPGAADAALGALLSKLRRIVGHAGRSECISPCPPMPGSTSKHPPKQSTERRLGVGPSAETVEAHRRLLA